MITNNLNILLTVVGILFIVVIPTVTIQSQNISFEQHPIDLNFQGIHAIKVVDLDDDGDLDIVGGSEICPTNNSIGIHWLRNDGGNPIVWTRIAIDASFEHVMSVDVNYIDNDNYPDIVASSWSLHQIAWWKNSGDPTQGWTKRIVRSNYINSHDAKCADIDQDGDVDIIAANKTPGSIIICLNDGSSTVNWQTSYLTNSFAGALRVLVVDLDKDDDLDILGTASDAGDIAWWENLGGNPLTWTMKMINTNFPGSSDLYVIDMNDDQVHDVIANAWSSNQVAYWICEDLPNNTWTKYSISNTLEVAAKVSAGDIDDDGDIDIITVGKEPGELVIYENINFNWTKTVLANDFYGGTALEVIDFDDDSDLDIIAGASYLGKLYWWENQLVSAVEEDNNKVILKKNNLFQNYPNPFNPRTKIEYEIFKKSKVTLKIYDITGKEIKTLVDQIQSPGKKSVEWNGYNNDNQIVASGIYIYQIQIDDSKSNVQSRRMVLIK